MKKIVLAGTFDTKKAEYLYFAEQLQKCGVQPILLDLGIRETDAACIEYPADAVARAAGTTIDEVRACSDRTKCMENMTAGAAAIINELYRKGEAHGFASMGGGQGTTMAVGIIRKLPLGMPKMLVSTILNLNGTAKTFEGIGNTILMNSVVDIAGLNPILKSVIRNAAAAISAAAIRQEPEETEEKARRSRVAISMWGVTTPCVDSLRKRLESRGCDVFVFHANGLGGEAMEQYASEGFFDVIVDLTIPELTMALAGSPAPAVYGRLLRSGRAGVKRIVSVGGADMVQYYGVDSIPPEKRDRKIYCHNPAVCFIRSSKEENRLFAEEIARRLSASSGKVTVALPLRGVSAVDVEGGPLYDPEADQALFDGLRHDLPPNIEILEYPCAINDEAFAEGLFDVTMKLLEENK